MIRSIGIIGGGPAGLYCGWLLARSGFKVTVFDDKIPFEKPCGGGITQKTFRDFPNLEFLISASQTVESFSFGSSDSRLKAEVSDNHLLHIISRKKLGELLLSECKDSGVRHIPDKVTDISNGTIITENGESFVYDFIIGADGANGISRRKLTTFQYDRWGGLGFYVDGLTLPHADIYFDTNRIGYLWVFPRKDHASVGFIALKGNISKTDAETVIQDYLDKNYNGFKIDPKKYYAATIPLTRKYSVWDLYNEKFALIGDAAGLVDPITGEGIYYAFASAKYLSDAIISGRIDSFADQLNRHIIPELQKSTDIFYRFYNSRILNNMVRLGYFSPSVSQILVRLISGEQSYLTLKKTLIRKIPFVMIETLRTLFLGRKA